jgi:predicted acylesterase/phospholipase RssA
MSTLRAAPGKQDVKHLNPDEIRYLALEGGGGKGFAYLGALQVLEKLKVMEHIDGVSGTSAGAITALMIAMGMTSEEIDNELKNDFNKFFDPPRNGNGKRRVPAPFQYIDRDNNKCEDNALSGSIFSSIEFLSCLQEQDSWLARVFSSLAYMYSLEGDLGSISRKILASITDEKDLVPVSVLLRGLPEYLTFFDRDMGFFSGEAARNYLDSLIRRQIEKRLGKKMSKNSPSIPFVVFKELFKRDLLVCGSNLATGKTVLFSSLHTPYFPVADAVRISMGLPFVYKPYVIEKDVPGWPPCGTYIDGGLWNNLPFREISNLQASQRSSKKNRSSFGVSSPKNVPNSPNSLKQVIEKRQTLGLRLGIDSAEKVLTGGDLLAKVLGTVMTAGESQVTTDIDPFILVLDTLDLETLKFSPPEDIKILTGKRSRRATYRYFGMEPPEDDVDAADDQRIKELMSKNACSVIRSSARRVPD